ncbi:MULTISPECIES: RimK family alpha-L-glutamate ligase [unclassified Streptomyces]|uniref:RimK family alpha-L-glutamate ligase n=1 Tax=Streptomyces TaxID=1883 RepID=UPI0001C18E88|nr:MULTISPECIES: RimK family alpha-L-glutamate ligase [unclassified Streptomyces]AEN09647.1 alpha-L-glutamate ligase, RimK family [Streptomyces sp. SirexAA-E]MYR70111.1 RimK family alpha-L-glutamate ligase [Streptomyces sp. SID4939]MYS03825.1 RimK family alpha-L-glutamate ligase [Streptomyces sp. SID4940]MYT64494.1 RimK family alpha-L-glutamate ligase [Streptomyces sp. SID8357]MYT87307.1 RimK family alpha-L-glutamate ligase [Streptomyces sp. SID8360]
MNSATLRLGVLASRVRFEEKCILAALERRGVACEQIDPRTLAVRAGAPWTGPRTVLNREVGHYRALYAASALESTGARVLNTAAAAAVCGDKWQTSAALVARGVPTPDTSLALTPDAALAALEQFGYPAVIKPLVGSWGRLVTRVTGPAMAAAVLEHLAALPSPQSHIVYVQREVAKADRDIRVLVVGGRAVGATYRRSDEWRTNVARGAVSERCPLDPGLTELAVAAAKTVGAHIAGVDLLQDPDGRLTVLEVNDRVEFRGLQQSHGTDIDVADAVAALLIEEAQA